MVLCKLNEMNKRSIRRDSNEIVDTLMSRYSAGLHKLAVILLVFFDNNNKVL